jgi:hypothetical protein
MVHLMEGIGSKLSLLSFLRDFAASREIKQPTTAISDKDSIKILE